WGLGKSPDYGILTRLEVSSAKQGQQRSLRLYAHLVGKLREHRSELFQLLCVGAVGDFFKHLKPCVREKIREHARPLEALFSVVTPVQNQGGLGDFLQVGTMVNLSHISVERVTHVKRPLKLLHDRRHAHHLTDRVMKQVRVSHLCE